MIVCSLDPGTTSGLVCWEGEYRRHMGAEVAEGLKYAVEIDGEESSRWMLSSDGVCELVMEWGCDVLLIEDFVLLGGKGHSSEREGLDPVRVTCGVLVLLKERGWTGDVVYFSPSVSSVFHDVRMKKWKLYLQGRGVRIGGSDQAACVGFEGHATSACRGLVWWLRERI